MCVELFMDFENISTILKMTSCYPLLVTSTSTSSFYYDTYLFDATSGNITFTLQNISSKKGITITLKRIDTSGNTVTIQGTGGELINGNSTLVLAQGANVTLTSFNGAWNGFIENGQGGNLKTNSTLTSNSIIKGNGGVSVQTSGISINSTNDLTMTKNSGFTTTLSVADLTTDRTVTLPNVSGTLATVSDLTNMVTEVGTNTVNNIMIGAGQKVIQDSGVLVDLFPRTQGTNIKLDTFFVSFNGGVAARFSSSNFSITGTGWSPTGTLTITVGGSYYSTTPIVVPVVGCGSSNPLGDYGTTVSSLTSSTSIIIYGSAFGSPGNLDIYGFVIGY